MVLDFVFQLNSSRLDMVSKNVVKTLWLRLLGEVVPLKHFQTPELVEADDAFLVKRNQ